MLSISIKPNQPKNQFNRIFLQKYQITYCCTYELLFVNPEALQCKLPETEVNTLKFIKSNLYTRY